MSSRRDRHGRGLRGPLVLPDAARRAPGGAAAAGDAGRVLRRLPWAPRSSACRASAPRPSSVMSVGVEDVPNFDPAWAGGRVPLASAIEASAGRPAQVVLYRRPLEHRAASRRGAPHPRLPHRRGAAQRPDRPQRRGDRPRRRRLRRRLTLRYRSRTTSIGNAVPVAHRSETERVAPPDYAARGVSRGEWRHRHTNELSGHPLLVAASYDVQAGASLEGGQRPAAGSCSTTGGGPEVSGETSGTEASPATSPSVSARSTPAGDGRAVGHVDDHVRGGR